MEIEQKYSVLYEKIGVYIYVDLDTKDFPKSGMYPRCGPRGYKNHCNGRFAMI